MVYIFMGKEILRSGRVSAFHELIDEGREIIPILTMVMTRSLTKWRYPAVCLCCHCVHTVLFPGVVIPIAVGRKKSVQLVREAYRGDKLVAAVAQLDAEIDEFRRYVT